MFLRSDVFVSKCQPLSVSITDSAVLPHTSCERSIFHSLAFSLKFSARTVRNIMYFSKHSLSLSLKSSLSLSKDTQPLSLSQKLFPHQVVFRQVSRLHFPFPICDLTQCLYTRISRCQQGLHYRPMTFGVSVCLSVIVLYFAQVAITACLSRNFACFLPRGWLLVLSFCLHLCGFPAACTMGRAPGCV